jgi:hypothetical protein
MFKKFFVMGLAALVLNLSLATLAAAETPEAKAAKRAEKVKANITKLGTGKDARIEVKLDNGTKLKGYVSQINDTSFVVATDNGTTAEVPYPQAKQVKGNNLSTGAKIAIGAAIVFGVLLIIGLIGIDR